MAGARGEASDNTSGDKGGTSTRPARHRVIRQDVQEVLKRPRGNRPRPKKQQPPLPPQPPPSRKEQKEKEKGKGKEKKVKEEEEEWKKKEEEQKEKEAQELEKKEKGKGKEKEEEEEQVEHARYNCAFQDEDEGSRGFAPPELVWGKVRSHPWWPGQVFDAADASEIALQHRKAGAPLVAYFWDRTFSWSDSSALLPFRANFTRLSAQSTMSGFVSAVNAALQEIGRRVEAGLSCSCFGPSIAKQEVQNSGIRQGAYGAAAVDASYIRNTFRGEGFLDYISALGKRPLAGADLLDLATAKAQLRAFNQLRGSRGLPEFVMFEGIEELAEVIPNTKVQRVHKSREDDVPGKERKPRHPGTPWCTKEAIPEAIDEDSSGGATDDTLSNKGNKSKPRKPSSKDMSKHSGELNAVDVAESRTQANKTADDILSVRKSGRTLRSMRKKEDALEGLKMLGKDDCDEALARKIKDSPLLKESKLRRGNTAHKKSKITEEGHGLGDRSANNSASPGKERTGHAENSMSNRVSISEHGRKKKKISELMAETGRPNSASDGKSKTPGKPSSHELTKKAEDPDCVSKDTVKNRKRKKLNTLGDLSSELEPLCRKKSTKVGESMSKASGSSIAHTAPPVKANGEVSPTKSRRVKHRQVIAAGKSPRPVKVNRGKKVDLSEESLSCDEMLWQLSVAACDLKQREKIAPASVNFFTDFRKNSSVSSSDVNEEIPEKAAKTESAPPERPIADHMQDDYWADILINVEEPLSSLKKKKDESKKRRSKEAHEVKKLTDNPSVTLENADEARSESKEDKEKGERLNAEKKQSQLNLGGKSAEEMEHSVLAGLVLHFSGPRAVPSRSDLIKIFSQYGPVSEAKAEIANNANSAQVIFKRRMDAEAAFAGAGKISALGPALVSFRLTDFPAIAPGNEPWHGASKRG